MHTQIVSIRLTLAHNVCGDMYASAYARMYADRDVAGYSDTVCGMYASLYVIVCWLRLTC